MILRKCKLLEKRFLVRKRAPFTETIYSLYVTDKERHLTGILSLRDLVTADPNKPIGDVMTKDVVNISTNTNQEDVARAIQRYDFSSSSC